MGLFGLSCSSDLCPENVQLALGIKEELWPELGVGLGRGTGVPDGGECSSPQTRAPAGPGGLGSCLGCDLDCLCCMADLRAPKPKCRTPLALTRVRWEDRGCLAPGRPDGECGKKVGSEEARKGE